MGGLLCCCCCCCAGVLLPMCWCGDALVCCGGAQLGAPKPHASVPACCRHPFGRLRLSGRGRRYSAQHAAWRPSGVATRSMHTIGPLEIALTTTCFACIPSACRTLPAPDYQGTPHPPPLPFPSHPSTHAPTHLRTHARVHAPAHPPTADACPACTTVRTARKQTDPHVVSDFKHEFAFMLPELDAISRLRKKRAEWGKRWWRWKTIAVVATEIQQVM